MKRPKRVALINDMTGFGRCSIAVQLPIISAMGVQGCILPTAILSAHTGYPTYYFDDYTSHMEAYMNNWKELDVTFDGITTGFLGSKEQIELVIQFIEKFRMKHTKVIVDPVMGDDGVLYATYT
ncbi:MAG: bifunctional hydroxymethylpyrimidine kinase/phosphomethylpyrimidine kinase, partial [Firmicutes bacterium]|nr:bifunctional hydroxymethylpyrimidine kinase/phosphomethylpyrimidine kinase [Candidatus Scybalomonas excrementavium]